MLISLSLFSKCIPEVDKGQQEECGKGSQNPVIIWY